MTSVNPFSWDTMDGKPEPDDDLHDPEKVDDANASRWTSRAILNIGSVSILSLGLLMLFAGYPVLSHYFGRQYSNQGGFGLGGTNGSGQVSSVPNVRTTLIDPDTPSSARTRFGTDGQTYNLVFSDEFNTDGRSFYPGDDPFWEAVDLHYWATNNYEWYDPAAVTTVDGALRITLSQHEEHNLNFRGGMVQTWNKFCFTGGIVVVSVRLPGLAKVPGLWPAIWMMGNLGRAGYGATLEGTWPYSYETCDVGTMLNQTNWAMGTPNPDTLNLGDCAFNSKHFTQALSYLPGQRLSACTCSGEDHPGPKLSDGSYRGRSAPEIDIFEAQVSEGEMKVSQSAQFAPFNAYYKLVAEPDLIGLGTVMNTYTGEVTQQAVSAVTPTDQHATQYAVDPLTGRMTNGTFSEYAVEYEPGDDGYIWWEASGKPAWKLGPESLAADPLSKISRRPIPSEPLYLIMNLGISQNFGTPNWKGLKWPNMMDVDWIRVYQLPGQNVGCDPSDYPTKDYINRHIVAYTNPNLTTWGNSPEVGGYGQNWPRNKLYSQGCSGPASTTPGDPLVAYQKAAYVPKAEVGTTNPSLCAVTQNTKNA
ncbi:glycoside hydrolase family 16 protein [Tilletiaria anomala UBC 951]|uniref:Glycoside hydrolase family 16 protein n=1 Tax=Tilletiaria anomala (strain ATCC 24038 / CBS 436.72 / UBC 951) TaxID=1037660 RepID=A0A066VS45_TILAU|nr:glycoside hydrolase family 16 protein [Tilletiaria anomala UBC 951]KDN44552.1 glycoside hydrolase family 16 protein [Tilletiaria anomala UBC 951]